MAEIQEHMKPKEREIPVFTVLKNNCILKNIFLLDKPPSISSSVAEDVDRESEIEETLVAGRHPDCNIKLEHPSVSRFHLRIHSKPSSRSLFVTDLSSVHGTWVSGRKIEPLVRVKLNEGDMLHLGASSRMYRLSWVPLSRAYEIDNPFVPQLDAPNKVDDETDERQGPSDNVEGQEGLLYDKDIGFTMQKMSPIEPKMPEGLHQPFCNEDEIKDSSLPEIYSNENELSSSQLGRFDTSVTVDEETKVTTDQDGVSSHGGNEERSDDMEGLERLFSDEGLVMTPMSESFYGSFAEKGVIENESPEVCNKENSKPQAHIPSAVSQAVAQAETNEYSGMNSGKMSFPSIWSRRGKPKSVKVETSQSRGNCTRINTSLNELKLKDPCESSDNTDETYTPDKENSSPDSNLVRSLKSKFEETLKVESIPNTPISSIDQDEEIFTEDKENMTPPSHILKSMKNIGKSGDVRYPKSSSADQDEETFTPDKENMTPPSHLFRSMRNVGESGEVKHPKPSSVDQDEDNFTPDKENMTPPSHLFKSMKNIGKSGEVKHPKSYRPSPLKIANDSNMYQDSKSAFSISKIHGLKTKQAVPKARPDREPFYPLLTNSSDRKAKSHTNTIKVNENRWTIIADTTILLNKKSRKELQLLRGLRGTTLVIPRIVVRELDCMIKRASFFSRMTEASAALNWIEECMAAMEQWIHVQSSAEEGWLVPPTPPAAASPRWFSEEKSGFSIGSIPFSPYSLQEIVTPTAADHILECALLFRRTTDGQLVLLSDDVALKIKAMAEGVVCETAQEFRRSVVNPFSPRFLYSDSSPIGPTWSCSDDTVLKENYYPSPSKKSGDRAKGLKLILLHNSNFRQMTN